MKLRMLVEEREPRKVRVNLPHELGEKLDLVKLWYESLGARAVDDKQMLELLVEAAFNDNVFQRWLKNEKKKPAELGEQNGHTFTQASQQE